MPPPSSAGWSSRTSFTWVLATSCAPSPSCLIPGSSQAAPCCVDLGGSQHRREPPRAVGLGGGRLQHPPGLLLSVPNPEASAVNKAPLAPPSSLSPSSPWVRVQGGGAGGPPSLLPIAEGARGAAEAGWPQGGRRVGAGAGLGPHVDAGGVCEGLEGRCGEARGGHGCQRPTAVGEQRGGSAAPSPPTFLLCSSPGRGQRAPTPAREMGVAQGRQHGAHHRGIMAAPRILPWLGLPIPKALGEGVAGDLQLGDLRGSGGHGAWGGGHPLVSSPRPWPQLTRWFW